MNVAEMEACLDRKHWAANPCSEHPGWDKDSCRWCHETAAEIAREQRLGHGGGLNKVTLTKAERDSIELQTGIPVVDAQDAKRALAAKGLRLLEKGEDVSRKELLDWHRSGAKGEPPRVEAPRNEPKRNPLEMREHFRRVTGRYPERSRRSDDE